MGFSTLSGNYGGNFSQRTQTSPKKYLKNTSSKALAFFNLDVR